MAKKRKNLSKRARFDVFKRDRFTCQYCGRKPPEVILEIDHVAPVSKGGENDDLNLVTSCFDCNRGKADGELTTIPASRARQIQDRRDLAEQTEALSMFLLGERQRIDGIVANLDEHWIFSLQDLNDGKEWHLNEAGKGTLRRFLKSLTEPEIEEAMTIACSRFPAPPSADGRTWRYFCGICWKWIKEGRDA